MWRRLLIILCLLPTMAMGRQVLDTLGVGSTVYFTENLGQWASAVRYEAQLHNSALFLEADGMTVVLREPLSHPAPMQRKPYATAYAMRFVGCQTATLQPMGMREGYSNYYLSSSPSGWRTGARSYAAVVYEGVYEGVDFEVYGGSKQMKYNWVVYPEGDVSSIAIDYIGVRNAKVDRRGNLHVVTLLNEVVEMRPYVFQRLADGREREVEARYVVEQQKEAYRVRIEVGDYDRRRPLVVDPVLIFSSYTGSTADNWGTTAAYDSYRNVYTAGLVFGIGYPVSLGVLDTSFNGACDVGIFKFDSTGSTRLWATYLGGTYTDMPHSMFVNHADDLLIFGTTGSEDFPVSADAYQTEFAGGTLINYESNASPYPNGSDLFVSRLTPDGQLAASTYVGGSGNDGLNYKNYFNNSYTTIMAGNDSLYYNYGDGARGEIITDNLGNIYIGSTTMSDDFPVSNGCVQPVRGGGQEGVVLKLDFNLRNIIWSTYLGGSMADAVYSVDVDADYNLLVAGGTSSTDFPTTAQGVQQSYGGGSADGFLAKLAYDGSRLLASTYYGSDAYDQVYFVRTGKRDEVFLFGQTAAEGSTMIHNAGYSVPGSGMLLARLSPNLDSLHWSTVFGTPGRINLSPTAFAADICNRVYAAGWGRDFVGYNNVQWYTAGSAGMETTAGAWCDSTDGQDFYLLSITADASTLEYATFFGEQHSPSNGSRGGGDHVDGGTSRFDRLATLYQSVCASCGGFNSFPTTANAWSTDNLSYNCNNALFRINMAEDFPVADFTPPAAGCAPYTVSFNNTGRGTSFYWDFGDGTTSTLRAPSHTYAQGGQYTVRLVANMAEGCATTDTVSHVVQVLSDHGTHMQPQIACNGGYIQIGNQPVVGATYEWQSGEVSDPTVGNPWVSEAGLYILTTSAIGCSQTDTFEVVTYRLVDSLYFTAPKCHDSADAQLVILLGDALEADSISYSLQAEGLPHPMRMEQNPMRLVADSLQGGATLSYTIEGYGCLSYDEVQVPNPARPAYRKQTSGWLCTDSCLAWVRFTPLSEQGVALGDTLFEGLCAGRHVITIEGMTACPVVDTTVFRVDHSLDSLRAWANRTVVYSGDTTRLFATAISGVSYQWTPSATLTEANTRTPIASPEDSITRYTVEASNTLGCSAEASVVVLLKTLQCTDPEQIVPNAFTPNGDGLNDRLTFSASDIVDFRIAIFNRWGEKVFETRNVNDAWDGTYHSQPCLQGVYTYTGSITCINGHREDFKGDITLIR